MKTVEAIIERLDKERNNGCAYAYRQQVERYRAAVDKLREVEAGDTPIGDYRRQEVIRLHNDINGFFWGLRATEFITNEERNQALGELDVLRWPSSAEEASE